MIDTRGLEALALSAAPRVEVGPGCWRSDLPSRPGVRIWVVDMEAGAAWPHADDHDGSGEDILVLAGEVIEGKLRFGPGTFLKFGPHTRHQPRTETGVRLFGFNLTSEPDLR